MTMCKNPPKFAIYARVSNDATAAVALASSEQVLTALAYGESREWTLGHNQIYVDFGNSINQPRHALEAMVRAARKKKPRFQIIVVDAWDRLFRDATAHHEFIGFMKSLGIKVHSAEGALTRSSRFSKRVIDRLHEIRGELQSSSASRGLGDSF
jgi:DNA invertase Pin-like site-specific DNA recombinase